MLTVRTFVSAGSPTMTPGWATTRTGICAESLASVKLTSRCYGDLWIEPAGHDRGKYEDRGTTEKIIQISWLGEHECHSELTRNGFHISSFVKQEDPVEATDGFVPFFFSLGYFSLKFRFPLSSKTVVPVFAAVPYTAVPHAVGCWSSFNGTEAFCAAFSILGCDCYWSADTVWGNKQ